MEGQPKVTCTVCGEKDFHLKEGYYYCNECGTKAEQVRAVEVELDDEFEDVRNRTTLKTKKEKVDKPELTSWECYNYILRGIVEELIELGAKDELKVMTLQIWAAYLRNKEVAFFSKRHPDLPKLGLRFEQRDASILYNHAKERKKKKAERKPKTSTTGSNRDWKRQVKKFEQSQYETSMSQSICSTSFLSQSSFGDSSQNSSGSAQSNRAIQLKFSKQARKRLKKKMPPKHIKKHEQDYDQSLTCHNIRAKLTEIKRCDKALELNMKLLYAIVAVALNLIEDNIQLIDLMCFVAEGHVSSLNVEHFFPGNMAEHYKEMLASIRFHLKNVHFSTASMRAHTSYLCKTLNINALKTPNILMLIQRYILELCLPTEIYTFIERLVNINPPAMEWDRYDQYTPCYESRAMAYIIFSLKLLFGLEGRKEKRISKSAKKVNAQLAALEVKDYDELFVWDDWVEYIEMRKVILCNNNLSICKRFNRIPPREMYLRHLNDRGNTIEKSLSKDQKKRQANMEIVFQHFIKSNGEEKPNDFDGQPKFTPSFTPYRNYFKRIQLDPVINASIPDFMQIDHTKRSLLPLLQPKELKERFANYGRKLNVMRISCTNQRNVVGIFRNPSQGKHGKTCIVQFDNDEDAWQAKLKGDKLAESIFKFPVEKYGKASLKMMRMKEFNNQNAAIPMDIGKEESIDFNRSIDLFEESDMEPSELNLTIPRRNLGRINLFADVSDDEVDTSQVHGLDNTSLDNSGTTTLRISNMDCWLLMGKVGELTGIQSIELKSKLPMTFFWLLETCALTLGVEWTELYEQLMVLEVFFIHAIEPLDQFQDRIIFKRENEIKDINKIVHHYKGLW